MKLSLAIAVVALTGCAATPKVVTAPSYPSAIHVTVDPPHCLPTKHQPDGETGLVSLLCVGQESYVGVVISKSDWNMMLYQPGAQ